MLDCSCSMEIIATMLGAAATAFMAIITWVSIRRSKKQFDAQSKDLYEQNFENGFLNRMVALKEARNNVYFHEGNRNITGAEAFSQACLKYYNGRNYYLEDDGKEKEDVVANYIDALNSIANIHSYYDSLAYVLSYARSSRNKIEYQKMVMNSLTDNENEWLKIYSEVCLARKKEEDLWVELQNLPPKTQNRTNHR